jgi:hypothetical protein
VVFNLGGPIGIPEGITDGNRSEWLDFGPVPIGCLGPVPNGTSLLEELPAGETLVDDDA